MEGGREGSREGGMEGGNGIEHAAFLVKEIQSGIPLATPT